MESGGKLYYQYWTTLEMYDDGTSDIFLNQKFTLEDVNTYLMRDDGNAFIRMSVGWRNPQEDAYDVTSLSF